MAEELQGRVVPEAYDLTRMNLEATLPDHRDDVREVPKQGYVRESTYFFPVFPCEGLRFVRLQRLKKSSIGLVSYE